MNLILETKPVDFGSYTSRVSETFARFPNSRLWLHGNSPDVGKWQWIRERDIRLEETDEQGVYEVVQVRDDEAWTKILVTRTERGRPEMRDNQGSGSSRISHPVREESK